MTTFSIEEFAAGCKQAMKQGSDAKEAARTYLAEAVQSYGAREIIRALKAAVPAGASIGELIVHASPELTMLYGRLPGRFQSGIHNHTVCAVIAQLEGAEVNRFYEPDAKGSLRELDSTTLHAGDVVKLDRDVIHSVENPGEQDAHALHLYKGDFHAVSGRRSLWSWDGRQQMPFSFPDLLRESASAMHRSGNHAGLQRLVEAMPASKAFVDRLNDAP